MTAMIDALLKAKLISPEDAKKEINEKLKKENEDFIKKQKKFKNKRSN